MGILLVSENILFEKEDTPRIDTFTYDGRDAGFF
jgi:hypothetical protein